MGRMVRRTVFACMCMILLSIETMAARTVIPGGQVIGIELQDGTVTVAAIDETMGKSARSAGVQAGDRIVKIDGKEIHEASDVHRQLERSDGTVELEVERDGKTQKVTVKPAITPEGPRLGVYLRQGVTGVGTVTWYDPDTSSFGALGHGVNTPKGQLLKMKEGSVYPASVAGVIRGASGEPGQLLGKLESREPVGELEKNTDRGIFGTATIPWQGQGIAVASPGEVKTGEATILSTVAGKETQAYRVEILKIYPDTRQSSRNMLLRVTDPQLLEATGGIVQGMSGSPLVQDGKLIGAVTHVLVNDPTMGYGIFIENMLEAAG